MNSEEFIESLKIAVLQTTIKATIRKIESPPGISPSKLLLELSHFYNTLDENAQEQIKRLIELTAESTLFGFLCVLDGVRAIEDRPDKGELVLCYKHGDTMTILNDAEEEFLHDLL